MKQLMKIKYLFIPIVFLCLGPCLQAQAAGVSSLPKVGNQNDLLFYALGGGPVVPQPGSDMITTRVTARFKLGMNYSCGKFNFQNNVAQMVNQVKTQVRQLPMQLQGALSAAIAGLPGYLLQKINPTLYNTITKTLDETAELFRLSYKSCEQMESEMQRRGKGYNPYNGFMQAVAFNKWSIGATNGTNIADMPKNITNNPTGPIKWLGGKDYGTVSNPVQINHDLVIAGYNIMLGRNQDVSIDTPPMGILANQPIVKIWPKPSDAGIWLQNIVGDKVIITTTETKPKSVNGKGLRPVVAALEPLIRAALIKAIDHYDFSDINKYSGVHLSSGIVDALRDMSLAKRSVYMDRLVSEFAVNETLERVDLIRQMLSLGLNNPDNVAAKIAGDAAAYVRKTTLPELKTKVNEIFETLSLRRTTVNSTALTILQQYNARQMSGTTATEGAGQEQQSPSFINGGVKPQ